MHHVAIMNKSWRLIPKILSGEKTIESRWYKTRRAPWGAITAEDIVYFKDSGSPVTAKATVSKVLQFDHYSQKELRDLLKKYGGTPGICFSKPEKSFAWTRDKNYTILVFLKDAKPVKPFEINKKGFGNACAWLTVKNIRQITTPSAS